ncbi:MAG TPA: hypothetical protein IAB38_00715 [Candidatus Onthousia excrementipullorum]|uniref:Uncharacterized protein n=1 Tax=Candidatus Onthousia excrementipullorum TaxID=2840884 RepID=A0A9D1DT80_9FIRM|nr:hypothetical protein [Candidatus Onthousia excrementipullorum]
MRERKVLNKKGFMLVETLIVGVFIMGIFSLLYTNFFPLIGEYERYKDYDTVESTYIAHWARMVALKGLPDSSYNTAKNKGYLDITDCSLYTTSDGQQNCAAFKTMNNVSKIYLTPYSTSTFKSFVKDNNSFSRSFREYIAYLPTYSKNTSKTPTSGYYRVIVEYVSDNTYKYGNIELYNGNPEDYISETPKVPSTNVGDVLLENVPESNQYDDGTDTFITGENPNNYIWYSGKLWRAVSVNNEEKTTKLVTQWNISSIGYSTGSTVFADSFIEDWLNDTTIDGFLGNLREPDKFIVMNSKWNATMDATSLGSIIRPRDDGTIVTDAVGLLNMYEYQSSYHGTTYSNGYLNNGLYWWTLTPYSSSNTRRIISTGAASVSSPAINSGGIRPTINLKSNIKIVDGDGTINNPYRLEGDNDTNLNGTLLNTRYSGEYIRFGNDENNLYRIVSHENGAGTKIVSSEPLKNSGTFITSAFGSNKTFSSTNTIGTFLNGDYLTNYVDSNYSEMIEDSTTWYLGIIGSGSSYKLAKYTDVSGTTITSNTANSKVGLLRFGELMAGQFDRDVVKGGTSSTGLTTTYWTLTPYSASRVLYVNNYSCMYDFELSSNMFSVRPSLNLKSNVIITGGTGTKSDPFTLALK